MNLFNLLAENSESIDGALAGIFAAAGGVALIDILRTLAIILLPFFVWSIKNSLKKMVKIERERLEVEKQRLNMQRNKINK